MINAFANSKLIWANGSRIQTYQALGQDFAFATIVCQRGRSLELDTRLLAPAKLGQQVSANGRQEMVTVK